MASPVLLRDLFVPEVISVVRHRADLWELEVGRDVGFGRHQAMLEWKRTRRFVVRAEVNAETRRAVGLRTADDELAEMLAYDQEMEPLEGEIGARLRTESSLLAVTRLRAATRLVVVDEALVEPLMAHGVTVWSAGYSRTSAYLQVARNDEPMWVSEFDSPSALASGAAQALGRHVWCDRVLAALTGGVVTERAVQAALAEPRTPATTEEEALGRDLAERAKTATSLEVPGVGTAQRVHLPAFQVSATSVDPFAKDRTAARTTVHDVPSDERWLLHVSPPRRAQ